MSRTSCQRDCVWAAVLVTMLAVSPSFADLATFQGLGDLPGGTFDSRAHGISADGSTVIGSSMSASGTEAFRWTLGGGMIGLGDLPGGAFYSDAYGASADGSVVVGLSSADSPSSPHAGYKMFAYANNAMSTLGPGAGYYGVAYDVSDDGSVITGEWHHDGFGEAFRYSHGVMQGLFHLGGSSVTGNYGEGISGDGAVIVGTGTNDALIYTATEIIDIGNLHGSYYRGCDTWAASFDGSVAVGGSRVGPYDAWTLQEAFRWTGAEGMVGLGDLDGGGFFSMARDVSADGSIVVGEGRTDNGDQAFIWDEVNGMRSLQAVLTGDYGLDLTGWQLRSAWGISADGLIITGGGIDPDGNTEAWIATLGEPVPAPGAVLLGILGLSVAGWRLKRTQLW
jgi:probable HAF family extracellular repeat protein